MSITKDELQSSLGWNSMVTEAVKSALGLKLDGEFTAVNYPAGFNYAVKQQYYNADTLSTLNLLLGRTDDIPSLSGSYSSVYNNVIKNIQYCFSKADEDLISQDETAQSALVGTIINNYKDSGLDDSPVDYPSVIYIMNRIKEVTGSTYLKVDIKEFPNLSKLCQKLSQYSNLSYNTTQLQNNWDAASDRLNAIQNNLTNPSTDNGGLATAANVYVPAWSKLPETEQILAQLKSESSITLTVNCDNISETSSSLHLESEVSSTAIPLSWFLSVKIDHENEYDIAKESKSESSISASITYNGVSIISAIPMDLELDNSKGWFDDNILTEAAEKSLVDATGYKIYGSEINPKAIFGKTGQLRRLKTFVISQQPIIHLTFTKFNSDELKEKFSQQTDVSFHMFGGLIQGSHSNNYSLTNYKFDSEKETIEVDIVPDPIGTSGSIEKQTASVLGGVADYYE